MSDTPNSTPGAGWYPDPAGGTLQRYWDGATWTDRTYDPISASSAPGVYPSVQPGTSAATPFIWVIALLPLVSLLPLLFIDYRQYLLDSITVQTDPGSFGTLPAGFGVQLLSGALGWGVYIASVVLAYFDWRALTRRGIVRPFHWAWAFLLVIPYVIGRAVVVRRRRASYSAPMWVYLAISFIGSIIGIVKAVDGLAYILPMIEQVATSG